MFDEDCRRRWLILKIQSGDDITFDLSRIFK